MELTLGRSSLHDGYPFLQLLAAHEGHIPPKVSKLEAYLKSLEDERQKIEAFKRELPICMQLLSNEIEASREEISDCKNQDTCRVFRNSPSRKAESTISQEMNLRSVEPNNFDSMVGDFGTQPRPRLSTSSWLQGEVSTADEQEVLVNELYRTRPTERFEKDPQACSHALGRRPGGAFVPFHKDGMRKPLEEAAETASPSHAQYHQDAYPSTYFSASTEGSTHQDVFPTAAASASFLSTSDAASPQEINHEPFPPVAAAVNTGNNGSPSQPSTPHRKPRRCWSTELHRKFVNALKQLGGSEVATPKQIRELMQVAGLTNDEIKSHLQKYRLHSKRPNPMNPKLPTEAAQAPKGTPQLVVLGGIWVPPEYPLQQGLPEYPLKQGLGHPLCISPLPHLMDPTILKQG